MKTNPGGPLAIKCLLEGDYENSIEISVLQYENSKAENTLDANWLQCELRLFIRPFSSHFNVSLTTEDFSSFVSVLGKMRTGLCSEARLDTIENSISIMIISSSTGGITIEGYVAHSGQETSKLMFSFSSDMTFVDNFYSSLKNVIKQFPVIEIQDWKLLKAIWIAGQR